MKSKNPRIEVYKNVDVVVKHEMVYLGKMKTFGPNFDMGDWLTNTEEHLHFDIYTKDGKIIDYMWLTPVKNGK